MPEANRPEGGARLAVDIGGTFTDIVLERSGKLFSRKVLTTPAAPEEAVLSGTALVLDEAGIAWREVETFIHGTTLATNALIERKGARIGLVTTEGFRDVLEIADEGRYDQYDIFIEKPIPLVPRERRYSVAERLDVAGSVRLPLDEAALARLVDQVRVDRLEAVAVVLIHAYANPTHEQRIGEALAASCPALYVTLSCEVCPEIREYERTSTAVANAYVQPLMAGYLNRLKASLAAAGYQAPIHMMTSGGTLASLDVAARFPVRLVESGPAGGAILASRIAAERRESKVLSFDMGGTTAKICLIRDFTPDRARVFEVDRAQRFLKGSGLPVRIPVIEMIEIGAGGGSIARVDALKRITVGPDSAASVPGPACYGRGGSHATVTDADLVLGRIDPARFAGGMIALEPAAAAAALDQAIGTPLGLSTEMAAHGLSEIVDENMASAARVHGVERGVTLRDYTLIAFGGAAPLHAARVAEKLGIERIVVPPEAGVGSAIGFLRAPAAYEIVRSTFMRLDAFDPAAATRLIETMSGEAHRLAASAAGGRRLVERRLAYMRYMGQGHEITVELPNRPFTVADEVNLRHGFENEYRRQFARFIPKARIEILSWSVFVGTEPETWPAPVLRAAGALAPTPETHRRVFDGRSGQSDLVTVIRREDLAPGMTIAGPAIVREEGTSTFVSNLFAAHAEPDGSLVLERKKS